MFLLEEDEQQQMPSSDTLNTLINVNERLWVAGFLLLSIPIQASILSGEESFVFSFKNAVCKIRQQKKNSWDKEISL